jgi:hypothetical protein
MTTNTKIIIGASVVALVGGYFIYKKMRGNKPIGNPLKVKTDEEKPPIKDETKPTNDTKPTIPTLINGIYYKKEKMNSDPSLKFDKYKVTTKGGNLNVRLQPNDKSKISETLSNGCEILTLPTFVDGWVEFRMYEQENCNRKILDESIPAIAQRFVSLKYLTPIK